MQFGGFNICDTVICDKHGAISCDEQCAIKYGKNGAVRMGRYERCD